MAGRGGRGTDAGGVQKGAEDHGEAQGRVRSVRGGRRRRQRTRERERGRGSPSPVVEQSLLEEESGLARRGDDEVAVAEASCAAPRRGGDEDDGATAPSAETSGDWHAGEVELHRGKGGRALGGSGEARGAPGGGGRRRAGAAWLGEAVGEEVEEVWRGEETRRRRRGRA